MSDTSSAESKQPSTLDADTNAARRGSGPLRIILIVVLLVMVGLLALDVWNKRASNSAFEKIQAWVDGRKKASPAEVHELIGREPDTKMVQKAHYYEETYSWRRGRLFDTYYVTVLYAQENDEPVLHEVEKNKIPDGNSIPNPPPPPLTEDQINPDRVEGGEFSGEGSGETPPADGEAPSADGDDPTDDQPTDGDESADGEAEPADNVPQPGDGDAAGDGEETPSTEGDE